jgi:hypothetical protein
VKKLLVSLLIIVFICGMLCGCTEPAENGVDIFEYFELVDHALDSTGASPTIHLEVRGQIKNIAGEDIDEVTVKVVFKDAANETLEISPYTLYDFMANLTYNFVADYVVDDEGFSAYDHYEIFIEFNDKNYLMYY